MQATAPLQKDIPGMVEDFLHAPKMTNLESSLSMFY